MGLNFRGQANRLKKEGDSGNQSGFQDKSAPGPRRGVGGDQPGSLARAEKRFGNITSPINGSSNRSTNPITNKAKGSPLKINKALVKGAALTGKKFVDVGEAVGAAFEEEPEPAAVDLSSKPEQKEKVEGISTLKPIKLKTTSDTDSGVPELMPR